MSPFTAGRPLAVRTAVHWLPRESAESESDPQTARNLGAAEIGLHRAAIRQVEGRSRPGKAGDTADADVLIEQVRRIDSGMESHRVPGLRRGVAL